MVKGMREATSQTTENAIAAASRRRLRAHWVRRRDGSRADVKKRNVMRPMKVAAAVAEVPALNTSVNWEVKGKLEQVWNERY